MVLLSGIYKVKRKPQKPNFSAEPFAIFLGTLSFFLCGIDGKHACSSKRLVFCVAFQLYDLGEYAIYAIVILLLFLKYHAVM